MTIRFKFQITDNGEVLSHDITAADYLAALAIFRTNFPTAVILKGIFL